MIYLILNILLQSGLYIAAGAIALVRASKAPSGKGLAFAGGALLVVNGLIVAAWNIWYRLIVYPDLFETGAALGPPRLPEWVFPTFQIGYRVLLAIAIALLLFAVLSARRAQAAQESSPAHGGPQGYGPQPGQAPGQGHYAQQGAPQQQYPGAQRPQQAQQQPQGNPGRPQQPQQPPQANPTGPQSPYQQPPQHPGGPQQPQQPRPGGHRRPAQPPENGPSGPQQPPQG
ncbi:hypothetical protein ACFXKD_26140 [Nocardiopsis aegyptia]|uniref:hypothetical protein n=1 Tax=Nocardiopsis aegyptia TaxID=220378 RepID=UPI00366A8D04